MTGPASCLPRENWEWRAVWGRRNPGGVRGPIHRHSGNWEELLSRKRPVLDPRGRVAFKHFTVGPNAPF